LRQSYFRVHSRSSEFSVDSACTIYYYITFSAVVCDGGELSLWATSSLQTLCII
jgi:hypothetical protein